MYDSLNLWDKGEMFNLRQTVVYIRQSLDRRKQKISEVMQKQVCRDFAKRNGFVIHDYFRDINVSGRTTEIEQRADLKRLMEKASVGAIQRVIVYKRDRLSRVTRQYMEIIDHFKNYGVELLFAADNEPPFLDGPIGEFMELILGGLSQAEAENIQKKLIDSRKTIVKNDPFRWAGGYPPYGYKSVDKSLQVKEDNREEIETLFSIVAEKKFNSILDCVKELNKQLKDKKYDANKLKARIRNSVYKGVLVQRVGGEEFIGDEDDPSLKKIEEKENEFEFAEEITNRPKSRLPMKIVESELWEKANENLKELILKEDGKSGKATEPYYLLGKIMCKKCKNPLSVYSSKQIYRCKCNKSQKVDKQELEKVITQKLDGHCKEIIDILYEDLVQAEKVKQAKKKTSTATEKKKMGRKSDYLTKKLDEEISKKEKYILKQKDKLKKYVDEWLEVRNREYQEKVLKQRFKISKEEETLEKLKVQKYERIKLFLTIKDKANEKLFAIRTEELVTLADPLFLEWINKIDFDALEESVVWFKYPFYNDTDHIGEVKVTFASRQE
ncbi:hypothetical protein JCM9157_4969 [Halalkalibacter akibai JCM 9157]|uniref:Recombinase family protein n=1 Tax=Halalkalibacter akibai (strain ATCC 43226 / DSM 21942 / CIP 109018 / JCM 9157 / 1139) TaxID=1236973 RepID=W4R0G3_HALA3|nr:hypothetical protein JCM9157_4969 [Halalkalibacter akibai JCM 9157]